ncbi:hypothetical protein IV203_033068 [Nitzschia inconspicua]|uniref:Uncharacterized protein n=1 Tax=Nitzschia inconspicua TaxID=303405 RepID=A0A9K3PFD4_9STRA|nr:hypothetical protein IV203_033068 [Nitzschia inconspicua]
MAGNKRQAKVVTPQRGTIASRYLQAISTQMAGSAATIAPPSSVVTPDVVKNHNANDYHHNNSSFLSSLGTVDCSSMTASTAMLDQSESWTTTGTKSRSGGTIVTPSSSAAAAPTTPTRQRQWSERQGNSNSSAANQFSQYNNNTPGSYTTIPLSGGSSTTPASSRPTTPTKHLPPPGTSNGAKSMMDNDDSSLESALSATAAAAQKETKLAIELGNLAVRQQQRNEGVLVGMGCGLTGPALTSGRPTTPTQSIGGGSYSCTTPSNSNHSRSHFLFPRTSPRTPTKSPGRSYNAHNDPTLTNPYAIKRSTGTVVDVTAKSPRSSTTPTSLSSSRPKSPIAGWTKQQQYHHHLSTTSEAGAPTEVMTNLTKDLVLTHRIPRNVRQDPSESGAPTEIMTNRTSDVLTRVRQNWNSNNETNSTTKTNQVAHEPKTVVPVGQQPQRNSQDKGMDHRDAGEGYRNLPLADSTLPEESQSLYKIPQQHVDTNISGRASRRINSYWNARKKGKNQHMPSLVDSQSSSVSSLPDERRLDPTVEQQHTSHSAHARLLDSTGPSVPAQPNHFTGNSDRGLSQHVQKARQQSILSPSASETTASMPSISAAVVNEPLVVVKSDRRRMLRQQHTEAIEEEKEEELRGQGVYSVREREEEINEHTGRSSLNGTRRDTEMAPQFRIAKWTIRGAQQRQTQQSTISENIRNKQSSTPPDPIISVTSRGEDYNGYQNDEDDESTLPEYTESHQRGGGDRANEFVVYNERSVRNAAAVFQSRGPTDSPKSDYSQEKGGDKERRRSFSQHSRYSNASTEREKSPIQPLFSLDRVDLEASDPPACPLRSRSMTAEQFLRTAGDVTGEEERPRRSQSLSRSIERNISSKSAVGPSGKDVPEYLFVRKASYGEEEDNSVLDEELVHIMEGNEANHEKRQYGSSSPLMSTRTETQSRRSTSDRARHYGSSQRPISVNEATFTPDRGHGGVLTTKSVKDKIRAFNMLTPGKWGKSPVVITSLPFASEKRNLDRSHSPQHSRPRERLYNEGQEEKKEEETIPGLYNQPIDRDDDSSVKSLRDKLEKRFAQRHASLGLGRDVDEANDDDYSVQSLRGKLEQKINEAQKDPSGVDDDDGSVRSLRERFEGPALKRKGEHVDNLRAMFESKPRARQPLPVKSKKTAGSYSQSSASFGIGHKVPAESTQKPVVIIGKEDSRKLFSQELTIESMRCTGTTGGTQNVQRTFTTTFEKGPTPNSVASPVPYDGDFTYANVAEAKTVKVERVTDNIVSFPTQTIRNEALEFKRNLPQKESNHFGDEGSARNSVFSRFNQWAKERQSDSKRSLANQDNLGNENDSFPEVSRTGSYDMADIREDDLSPNTDDLIAAVSDDEQRMVPGSHWTARDEANARRKMPQPGDIKGASSESDYSEAVTLDASIAEVSLLTNPSPIRSKCSRDSRDAERNSDASSSVFELFAKKSETSSIQPSESAAPLIPGPLHRMSDQYVHDASNKSESSTSAVLQNRIKEAEGKDHHALDARRGGNISPTRSAFAGSREIASEWHKESFPWRKEPPDDPFQLDPTDISTFSDSEWPDFGDKNEFPRVDRTCRASMWDTDPLEIPKLQNHIQETTNKTARESRRLDPPSTSDPQLDVSSTASLSKKSPLAHEHQLVEEGQEDNENGQQNSIFVHRPTKEIATKRDNETARQIAQETCHQPTINNVGVGDFTSLPDCESSGDHVSRQTTNANNRPDTMSREKAIQIPEVPPLPSPFDPNYASIMEARHKMLLIRQRALLHRRATREKNQANPQPSFFGRTHPERPSQIAPVAPQINFLHSQAANPSDAPSNSIGASDPEPWEAFGTDDPLQQTFEALTRPRNRNDTPPRPSHHPPVLESTWKAPHAPPKLAPVQQTSDQRRPQPTFYSKIKSTFGLNNEYKEATKSEAVIARITAVRAARMRRYQEKNAANVSYRQRIIDREPVVGYRFYTHGNDDFGMPPEAYAKKVASAAHDDTSLSTNSNAVDYAANLAID